MGIEGFNPFIEKHVPNAMIEIPVVKFANTVIAIDAHNYVYTNMYVSLKRALADINLREDPSAEHDNNIKLKNCIGQILRFVVKLTSYSITPVFVFDGPNIFGKVIRIERKKRNDNTYEQIGKKTTELEQLDPLERTDEDVNELRRLRGSVTHVRLDEMELFKTILRSIGIPVIQADGDGEHICCMMVREGLASAVFSRDTDCMVYGTQFMIKKMRKPQNKREDVFEITQFAPILPALDISYKSFVDLCIMSKCDYNQNIYNIGIGRAYKLIKKHSSIEIIELREKLNIECLNHEACRKEFSICPAVDLLHESHEGIMPKLVINKSKLGSEITDQILRTYECEDILHSLNSSYRNITSVFNIKADMISDQGKSIITKTGMSIIIKGRPLPKQISERQEEPVPVADDPLSVLRKNTFESYD